MTQSAKKNPKLWLVESSPSDPDRTLISERMGMTLCDFLGSIGIGEGDSRLKPDKRKFVWPKHTGREIVDPAEPVYQHDYSDQTWTIRYKALGCYDLPSLKSSHPRDNARFAENSALFPQIKEQSLPDVPKNTLLLRKEPPASENTITTAQKYQLLSDLQLSESDDDSDSELPNPDHIIPLTCGSSVKLPSLVISPRREINVSETLASIPAAPFLVSPLPAESPSAAANKATKSYKNSVNSLRRDSQDNGYKMGTKSAKNTADSFRQPPTECNTRPRKKEYKESPLKPVSVTITKSNPTTISSAVTQLQTANVCSPLSVRVDAPTQQQQQPLLYNKNCQRLSNQENFDESGRNTDNGILPPMLVGDNRQTDTQSSADSYVRQVLAKANAYPWYPLQLLTDNISTDDEEEGGELDTFSQQQQLDERIKSKKGPPPIRRKLVFAKAISPLPSEPISNGVASLVPVKNNLRPKNKLEKNSGSSSTRSSIEYASATPTGASKRTHSSERSSTPHKKTSISSLKKIVKPKQNSVAVQDEPLLSLDVVMPPPDVKCKRKRSRYSSSTTEEFSPPAPVVKVEKTAPKTQLSPPTQALVQSRIMVPAPAQQSTESSLRTIPTLPWVLSSLSANDMRLRIPKIVSQLSTQMSMVDKLASLRFILTNLRVTGIIADIERPLTGVLLLPESQDPPISKPEQPKINMCETGTCTTPRPMKSDHGVQYNGVKKKQYATQMSPFCYSSTATNTSPPLEQASACIGTSFSPLRFKTMEHLSVEESLQKVLKQNDDVAKQCEQSFSNSTVEQQCITANQLNDEANACWKKLVTYVQATSSASSVGKERMKQFVCSCGNPKAVLHFLFNNQDFAVYPEKLIASTRHLLIAAHLTESSETALKFYDQITTNLMHAIDRLHRLESKLIRRACTATQSRLMTSSRPCMNDIGAREWSDLWYSVLSRIVSIVRYKMWQLLLPREEHVRKKIEDDAFLRGLELDKFMGDSPLQSPSQDAAKVAESLNVDSVSSGMCTLPMWTVARLIKLANVTNMAQQSHRHRMESESVLSTERYTTFGGVAPDFVNASFSGGRFSSPTYDEATTLLSDSEQQFPVFPAPTGNIGSVITYLDGVLRRHKRMVARLGTCPDVSRTTTAILSPSPRPFPAPNLPVPTVIPPYINKFRPSISPPAASVKRKHKRESQAPAFEDLPIRPSPIETESVTVKKKKKRQISEASADDTDVSTTRDYCIQNLKKIKRIKNREPSVSSGVDEVGPAGRKKSSKHRSKNLQLQPKPSFSVKNNSTIKGSRSKSVVPESRASPQTGNVGNFDIADNDTDNGDNWNHAQQKRTSSKKSSERRYREKSVPRSVHRKYPHSSPQHPPTNRTNSSNIYKIPGNSQNDEAYSPSESATRLSYSPTRPDTSSDASFYRASKVAADQQYVPSVPRTEPSTSSRRTLLSEPPQTIKSVAENVPQFFAKWMHTGSSASGNNNLPRVKSSSSSFRPKLTPLPPPQRCHPK